MRLSSLFSALAIAPAVLSAPQGVDSRRQQQCKASAGNLVSGDKAVVDETSLTTKAPGTSAIVTTTTTTSSVDVEDAKETDTPQQLTNVATVGAQGQINAVYYPNW